MDTDAIEALGKRLASTVLHTVNEALDQASPFNHASNRNSLIWGLLNFLNLHVNGAPFSELKSCASSRDGSIIEVQDLLKEIRETQKTMLFVQEELRRGQESVGYITKSAAEAMKCSKGLEDVLGKSDDVETDGGESDEATQQSVLVQTMSTFVDNRFHNKFTEPNEEFLKHILLDMKVIQEMQLKMNAVQKKVLLSQDSIVENVDYLVSASARQNNMPLELSDRLLDSAAPTIKMYEKESSNRIYPLQGGKALDIEYLFPEEAQTNDAGGSFEANSFDFDDTLDNSMDYQTESSEVHTPPKARAKRGAPPGGYQKKKNTHPQDEDYEFEKDLKEINRSITNPTKGFFSTTRLSLNPAGNANGLFVTGRYTAFRPQLSFIKDGYVYYLSGSSLAKKFRCPMKKSLKCKVILNAVVTKKHKFGEGRRLLLVGRKADQHNHPPDFQNCVDERYLAYLRLYTVAHRDQSEEEIIKFVDSMFVNENPAPNVHESQKKREIALVMRNCEDGLYGHPHRTWFVLHDMDKQVTYEYLYK